MRYRTTEDIVQALLAGRVKGQPRGPFRHPCSLDGPTAGGPATQGPQSARRERDSTLKHGRLYNHGGLPLRVGITALPPPPIALPSAPHAAAAPQWDTLSLAFLSQCPALPESHGCDFEDLQRYLTRCEEYIATYRLPEVEKAAITEGGLKGEAEK